jgi:hypothetical protein
MMRLASVFWCDIMRTLRTIVMRILGLVIIALFGALGVGIMYLEPMSVLTCRYVGRNQVDCRLQERIAWVIPVREIPVTDLKEAYVKTETETRVDEDERAYTVYLHRVILVSASGEIGLKGTEETGSTATLTSRRINEYLNTRTVEPLTVWGYDLWGHTLATLGGGFLFIVFGFLFVAAIVDMVVGLDTVAGLYQKVYQKRPRYVVRIEDTLVGLYQKAKRRRSVIWGPLLGALLGGYLLGFSLEGMGLGGVIGLGASLAAGGPKDKPGPRVRQLLMIVMGLIFFLVIARTTTVTCGRVEPSLPVTCEFTRVRLLWTTVGEFEPYNGGLRGFPYGIRRALAVGEAGYLTYYQYDNRVISYIVGSALILAVLRGLVR